VAVRKIETVDETAARSLDIECAAAADAEPPLHDAGGAWEDLVRRSRGDDDQVDIFRGKAGHIDCLPGGGESQVGRRLTLGGDVPSLDPGSFLYPLIRCFHHRLEVVIRQDLLGQIAAGAGDT
jgi:hypothetical protein